MIGCGDYMVKVCGTTRQVDADLYVELKIDMIGFIFHAASPRAISPEKAAGIDTGPVMRVGLFVDQKPEEVLEIMDKAKLHMAQLHGDQDPDFCKALGKTRIMRVFWPERYPTLAALEEDTARFASYARFFLFDAGTQSGGHGKTFDWTVLADYKPQKSWFLAGGIGPDNVPRAMACCTPCGLDLNSGIESAPGVKDHDKLRRVIDILCAKRQD